MEKQSNSYKFLEKVADELMDNIQLSPPVVEHGDPYYDFWFGWDNNMTYRLSINDLEKMRESGQPLVEITKDIVSQTISDFFVLFEDRYGYYNIDDIVNVLARFFIPKLYNRYLKEDDTPDAPIVMRENKNMESLVEQTAPQIRQNVGKIYHKNGFINRIVTDILKMTILRSFKVLFDFNGLGFSGGHHLPQLLYRWNDNLGLTEDSINVVRRNMPELVKQYLKKQDLSSGDDDPTIPVISEILSDEIIEQINNYQRDEDWEHWNEEWILAEEKRGNVLNKKKEYLDKVKKKVVDSISEDDRFWNFNDMVEPTYDGNVAPVRLQKNGLLNSLNGDWLFDRFRDYYGELYALSYDEVVEIFNTALYHIFKNGRLDAMNSILIGDWDLEYTPSLILRKEDWGGHLDRDYDFSKIEDYMKFIKDSRYDIIDFHGVGSYSKFFRGGRAYDVTLNDERYTDGWTKEDFKPYHEDLISDLENYHGQKLTS